MTTVRILPRSSQWLLVLFLGAIYSSCFGVLILTRLAYLFNWAGLNSLENFPNTQQVMGYLELEGGSALILMGPMMLCLGFPLTLQLVICRILKIDPIPSFLLYKRFYLGSALMTSIGFFFSVFGSAPFIENFLFHFDPIQITEIQVVDETKQCPPLIINNSGLIIEGFKWLKVAEPKPLSSKYFSRREYSIKLIFANPTLQYNYLMIYEYTTSIRQGKTVVPQLFADNSPRGGYNSVEFFEWVDKNIDPYFHTCGS